MYITHSYTFSSGLRIPEVLSVTLLISPSTLYSFQFPLHMTCQAASSSAHTEQKHQHMCWLTNKQAKKIVYYSQHSFFSKEWINLCLSSPILSKLLKNIQQVINEAGRND